MPYHRPCSPRPRKRGALHDVPRLGGDPNITPSVVLRAGDHYTCPLFPGLALSFDEIFSSLADEASVFICVDLRSSAVELSSFSSLRLCVGFSAPHD